MVAMALWLEGASYPVCTIISFHADERAVFTGDVEIPTCGFRQARGQRGRIAAKYSAACDAHGGIRHLQIGDAEPGPELLKLFRDPKQPDNVRDTCAYSLALLRYRPAVADLLSALSDPSPSVRLCVVAALAAITA